MKKAVIYARQSSGDEEKSASIDQQIENCRKLAEREGYEIIDVFSDLNISGKTYPDLPDAKVLAGLDSAYQEWKKGLSRSDVSGRFREGLANVIHLLPQVDFVLLDSNSRLMRPKRLTHVESYIKEYFCRYDVKLHVVKSGIIDFSTFTGSFMTSVEGQINDEQISSQLTNSRAALKKLKDEGFFNSGGDRLGYKFLRKHRYEIVPEEAELIRFAFRGIVAGMPYTRIVKQINERFRRQKVFTTSQLKDLTNRLYLTGFQENSKGEIIECQCTKDIPIIDYSTFRKAQEVVRQKRAFVSRERLYFNPFAGIVKCGYCGKQMYLTQNHGHTQAYRCKTGTITNRSDCNTAALPFKIDAPTGTGLYDAISPLLVAGLVEYVDQANRQPQYQENLDKLVIELENISQKETEIAQMYADGKLSSKQVETMMAPCNQRRSELEKQIQSVKRELLTTEELDTYGRAAIELHVDQLIKGKLSDVLYTELLRKTIQKILAYQDRIEIESIFGKITLRRVRQGKLSNLLPRCTFTWDKKTPYLTPQSKILAIYINESYYHFDPTIQKTFESSKLSITELGVQFPEPEGRYARPQLEKIAAHRQFSKMKWSEIDKLYKGNFREVCVDRGIGRTHRIKSVKRNSRKK